MTIEVSCNSGQSIPVPIILLAKGMDVCPVCGSSETEGESFNTEGDNRISQEMSCLVCESQWFNYYALVCKDIIDAGLSLAEREQRANEERKEIDDRRRTE